MIVDLLNDKTWLEIKTKRIYCFGLSYRHIEEMICSFPILDNIEAIFDNNYKIWGNTIISNKLILVTSPEQIEFMDFDRDALVITNSFVEEVVSQLKNCGYLSGKKVYKYVTQKETIENHYAELYRKDSLEDIIVFRSGPHEYVEGTDFYDNSRALFEYMVSEKMYEKYKLVWFVKEPAVYKDQMIHPNIEFISYDWHNKELEEDKYFYYLYHARYIFTTDAFGFMRRVKKEQTRVQLWHGCGYKTRVNFNSCEHRYDYTIVVSDLYAEIHKKVFGLRDEQILVTGYPKQDWLFRPYDERFITKIGIKKGRKYIFWLPTFRKANDELTILKKCEYDIQSDTGFPIVTNQIQMYELNNILKEIDIILVIKLHYLQKEEIVQMKEYSNICMLKHSSLYENDVMLNRLLAYSDALITDYSSVAVDYLALNKPIAFTLDDLEEYKNNRGFVFEDVTEWLPGEKIYDFEQFCEFIMNVAMDNDVSLKERQRLTPIMNKFCDDQNSKRVLGALHIEV